MANGQEKMEVFATTFADDVNAHRRVRVLVVLERLFVLCVEAESTEGEGGFTSDGFELLLDGFNLHFDIQ